MMVDWVSTAQLLVISIVQQSLFLYRIDSSFSC
jgi:hypothetical protein